MDNSMNLSTPAKNEQWNWVTMYKIAPDILDDLCSRFIVNVPEEERKDLVRLCFQIELAHWFYIDFYCSEENSSRKHCSFREFAANIFKHLSLLKSHLPSFESILEQFREYKQAVPTFGAILLNEQLTHVLLVQGYWSKNSWGFPKGKVNEGEDPSRCAVREVLEETGFDISHLISKEFLETTVNDQLTRLYIIPGVPHDSKFIPRTRNEIRAVQWFSLADLPTNKKDTLTKSRLGFGSASFFMVFPFVRLIRNWIACRSQKQQQQISSSRKKQRRKSVDEKPLTKTSSEEDSEFMVQHLANMKMKPSNVQMMSSASQTTAFQPIIPAKQGKNMSRRQLFIDKGEHSRSETPQALESTMGQTNTFCAPSWLNFRLNMGPILACYD